MLSSQAEGSELAGSPLLFRETAGPPVEAEDTALHLWTAAMPGPGRFEASACRALMSDGERRHEARLRRPQDRREYRWTRAVIRTVLSRYSAVDPRALEFTKGPWGKPEISTPANSQLEFSLAHTEGIVVLLVGQGRAVGVDVESERRPVTAELARSVLGRAEAASIESLPPALRPARFLAHWTLKESYAKARGTGLVLPLEAHEFAIEDGRVRASIDAGADADPELWWFSLPPGAAGFVIAVAAALHSPSEAPLRLRTFSALPGRD